MPQPVPTHPRRRLAPPGGWRGGGGAGKRPRPRQAQETCGRVDHLVARGYLTQQRRIRTRRIRTCFHSNLPSLPHQTPIHDSTFCTYDPLAPPGSCHRRHGPLRCRAPATATCDAGARVLPPLKPGAREAALHCARCGAAITCLCVSVVARLHAFPVPVPAPGRGSGGRGPAEGEPRSLKVTVRLEADTCVRVVGGVGCWQ
mmetsp:Transcript_5194/g.13155  ORF Transcript_5194/g.13155 Transcript_5194/m.13155 type:complete len:201 (-) Transcript_5194:439-1041(-)